MKYSEPVGKYLISEGQKSYMIIKSWKMTICHKRGLQQKLVSDILKVTDEIAAKAKRLLRNNMCDIGFQIGSSTWDWTYTSNKINNLWFTEWITEELDSIEKATRKM